MWSAEGDGSVKSDQEMTNILNSLKKHWIRTLKPIRITLECKLAASGVEPLIPQLLFPIYSRMFHILPCLLHLYHNNVSIGYMHSSVDSSETLACTTMFYRIRTQKMYIRDTVGGL